MQGEKAGILGSLTANMNKEFIDTMFDRLFDLSIENNWLPQEIKNMKDAVKIDYEGLLAQAQRRYFTVQSAMQAIGTVAPLFQIAPDAIDYINTDEVTKDSLREGGLPEKDINSDKDVAQIRQKRAQAQEKAQQLEQYKNYADAESKMSKARERGGNVTG